MRENKEDREELSAQQSPSVETPRVHGKAASTPGLAHRYGTSHWISKLYFNQSPMRLCKVAGYDASGRYVAVKL